MQIPVWMATAIMELGLTKEDFDTFFVGMSKHFPPIGRSASKARPVMTSGTPEWKTLKDIDPIWDEISAFYRASGCMMGDDGLMTVVGCDED